MQKQIEQIRKLQLDSQSYLNKEIDMLMAQKNEAQLRV